MCPDEAPAPVQAPAGLDEFLGSSAPSTTPPAQPSANTQSDEPPGLNEFVAPEMQEAQDKAKYSTPGQQLGGTAEALARGFAGPLATGAELALSKAGIPGLSAEDQAGREEAMGPIAHGLAETAGLVGGALTGVGEAGLIGSAAEHLLPAGVSLAGKVGAGLLKGFVENGLIQGGDELSKAMLGQGDPEAPVASALADMGAAGLIGAAAGGVFGGVGAKLRSLGEAKAGTTARNEIANLGSRWKWNQQNPELLDAVTQELTDFHGSTADASEALRGGGGLKEQAIDKLSQAVTPEQAAFHVDQISKALEKAPTALKSEPVFQDAINDWKSKVYQTPEAPAEIDPNAQGHNPYQEQVPQPTLADPASVFKATDGLKRQLQEWGQYNKTMVPLSEVPFRNAAKNLGYTARTSLEDPKVWGDLGDLQSSVNKATSDFIPALKDFNSKFTTKIEGSPTLDPGKINTYVNQLGKPGAEIKKSVMENFITSAEKYRDEINNVHASLGVERPIAPSPLTAVKGTYAASTPGGDLADYLYRRGVPSVTDPLAARLAGVEVGGRTSAGPVGAALGYLTAGRLAPILEKIIGRPVANAARNVAVPAIIRGLSSGTTDNLWQVLDHASSVTSGAQKARAAVESLFKSGGQQTVNEVANERDREKLRDFIAKGGVNSQALNQNQVQKPLPSPSTSQNFAKGGAVQAKGPAIEQKPSETKSLTENTSALSQALPEQNMLMQTARGRVSNYLSSIAPVPNPSKLPFDHSMKDHVKERSYNKALDIANNPLSVLNHVKNGTLTLETLKHFASMYPELHSHLSKKITERVSQSQLDKEKPDYRARMGMSLFMTSPLDSTMTPNAIMAAQPKPGPAPQQQAQSDVNKPKRGTASLSKAGTAYMTNTQAAEQAQSKKSE